MSVPNSIRDILACSDLSSTGASGTSTPFPGEKRDPYLERRGLWEDMNTNLISHIRQFLIPLLRPNIRVAIEQRTILVSCHVATRI